MTGFFVLSLKKEVNIVTFMIGLESTKVNENHTDDDEGNNGDDRMIADC